MKCPRVAIFDLDDTLAESFQPPTPEMLSKIGQILELMPFAIITAAGFPRMQRDFLPILEKSAHVERLYILPNSSAEAYVWRDGWNEEYSLLLTLEDQEKIQSAIRESDQNPDPRALILDRGVQVAYASIGLDASLEEKKAWDPDQSKRKKIQEALDKKLPGFEVLIGGMTTIDITKKGVDKAYGVRWLSERLKIPPEDMLYVGDALYPGGNDQVVIATGIPTRSVADPSETLIVLDELLAACGA